MNATLTTAPVKTNTPKRHLFTLQATIDEATYNVFPVRQIDDPEIAKAFTFRKLGLGNGDSVYTVARHADGRVTCECPDFVTRHEDHGTLCKHGQCCVRMGLLDAPTTKVVEILPQPSPDPAPEPATSSTRQPELRRIAGMTIDLDVWRNGPRAAQDAPRAFGQGLEAQDGPVAPETPTEAPRPCCAPTEAEPCRECLEAPAPSFADDLANAAERPGLSLVEWLRHQVEHYRLFGTDAADLVAEHLGELVAEAEITRAATPGQLRDRRAVLAMP